MTKDELLAEIRKAFANYRQSEGCSCCENVDEHTKHTKILAELLNVPMYEDGSGYDFRKFIVEDENG